MENSTIPFPGTPSSETTPEAEIEGLAERIQAAHTAFESAHRASLEKARECGDLLIQAKAMHKHGGWLAWLKANVPFSARTAQYYIKISERWDDIVAKNATVSYLTLRMANDCLKERPIAGPPRVVSSRGYDPNDPFNLFCRQLFDEAPAWRKRYERFQKLRERAQELSEQLKAVQEKERQVRNKAEKVERKLNHDLNVEFRRREEGSTDMSDNCASTSEAEASVACTA